MQDVRITLYGVMVLAGLTGILVSVPASGSTVKLDEPEVLAPGGVDFQIQGVHENRRQRNEEFYGGNRLESTAFRIGLPFTAWGLVRASEVRFDGRYARMDDVPTGFDEEGREGLRAGFSFQYTRNFAISVDYITNQDDVLPYGGLDEHARVWTPWKIPSGPGFLVGEFGHTWRWDNRLDGFDYGIGYVFNATPGWSLGMEFFSEEKITMDGERFRQIWFTSGHRIGWGLRIIPFGSVGASEGSPEWSTGLQLGWRRDAETAEEEVTITDQPLPVDEDHELLIPPGSDTAAAREASRGLRAYELGRLGLAERLFRNAWEQDKSQPMYAYNVVAVQVARDRLGEAFVFLENVRKRHPENHDLMFAWAYLHYLEGRYKRARTLIEELLKQAPEHQQANQLQQRLQS